ncbi:MAG: pyrimidine utilization protein B [Chloroflexi bacterium RBG_16_56_11]|nr:MAG: pyrimidine utilization protein B [Chloroflexi bacterium RBG_16_56_11]
MELTLPARPEAIKLDTNRTALIIVDMQNAFCKKGGLFDYLGHLDEKKAERVIAENKKVIEACRRGGIKIVYLRMGYRPDLSNAGGVESPNYFKELGVAAMRGHPELKGKFLVSGSQDWQIIDELQPRGGDIIVDKHRYSGFANTELDTILRTYNIKYLLFIGLATNVCVESTLREAYFHEYFPVLVSDGCGNIGPDFIQDATIWNVTNVFGWVTETATLVEALG